MIHRIYHEGRRKFALPIRDREELMALRNAPDNLANLEAARKGDTKAKLRLLQLAYNVAYAEGPLAGCKRIGSQFFHDVDCYDASESAAIKERILSMKEQIGLLLLEQSVSGGWHLVCRRQPGTTILENQVRIASILRLEMDTNTKDLQRVAFSTSGSEDDLVYLDDAIFGEPMSPEQCEEEYTRLAKRQRAGQEQLPAGARKSNKHYRPWEKSESATVLQCYSQKLCQSAAQSADDGQSPDAGPSTDAIQSPDAGPSPTAVPSPAAAPSPAKQYPTEYKNIPYSEILHKYWQLFNEGKEPTEGDRDTLTYQLACDLRHICGRDPEWLDQVIPCYDGFPLEEKRKKIDSALQARAEGMPYRMRRVLQALRSEGAIKASGGTITTPPPMPAKLPPLIRLLTSNVPDLYKPAVASAVFPALAAHLHGVKFRYWDNVEHEATFMNILIGRQSVGKGTIKKPIEYIMEDIRQRDIPNRRREAEWKQRNPGAKQKKDPRPGDICIQMLIDNLTDAVFNQRVVDAHNNGQRYIYTIVDEIEALKKVTSKGTTDEVGLLIRKAFDNSLAGQERVGADSVSGIAPLRWNFNASTTPPNARRFFMKMVNDGTVSRLDIATIIRNDDDDMPPILGIYDNTFASELAPYLARLEAANGLIECPQSQKLALELRRENSDAANLYDSEAYKIFSYRANVIAWLKGMVLYVAQGEKWDSTIADFVRWSQQYNLWCKMLYFGQQMELELREEMEIQRQSGPQNLLELLPDEFTREEYLLMRQQQGKRGGGESTLRTWASRGYIAHDEVTGNYCKTDEYLAKMGGQRL